MAAPHRTKPFKRANSQAVRLPKGFTYPEGTELEIVKDGSVIEIRPTRLSFEEVVTEMRNLPRPSSVDVRDTEELLDLGGTRLISTLSHGEFEGGACRDPINQSPRRIVLDLLLSGIKVLKFGDAKARAYGQIVAQAGYSCKKLIDRMMAAQVIVAEVILVTLNSENSTDILSLKVHPL